MFLYQIALDLLLFVLFVYPIKFIFIVYRHKICFCNLWLTLSFLSDCGCLLFGKAFGRTKFQKTISPNKTLEGVYGGFILTTLTAYLAFKFADDYVFPILPLRDYLLLGLIISFFSTVGDLIESFIKRAAEVKDSGTFFPGHGGFLDRVKFYCLNVSSTP